MSEVSETPSEWFEPREERLQATMVEGMIGGELVVSDDVVVIVVEYITL